MANRYEDGALKPTVAGVLMAAADPRTWLPNAFIQAVAYRGAVVRAGTSDPYQLDATDLCGPLDEQVAGACKFCCQEYESGGVQDAGTPDVPQFDMAAVFEAVVNAVAHRDYSIHGSKIRLRLFENRLEIYSPGALPNTISVDELPLLQATRNEVLTSLLGTMPCTDERAWVGDASPNADGQAWRRRTHHLGTQHGAIRQEAGIRTDRWRRTQVDDLCGGRPRRTVALLRAITWRRPSQWK